MERKKKIHSNGPYISVNATKPREAHRANQHTDDERGKEVECHTSGPGSVHSSITHERSGRSQSRGAKGSNDLVGFRA
eukprot:scaffold9241_cov66-Phaeocystis_antarctica.AAC.3